ncbi:MAG: hypothetical protein IJ868_06270 [Prevotella sp.]|nr:hypothetical protein [Prevotella sp.]
MKKIMFFLMTMVGVLTAQADDATYSYLTFETADGAKTSVAVTSLPMSVTVSDGTLTVGGQTFTLADLSKMYFSNTNETTAIQEVKAADLDDDADIYDLQGRKVTKAQMRRGIYVVKTNGGTYKVNVR